MSSYRWCFPPPSLLSKGGGTKTKSILELSLYPRTIKKQGKSHRIDSVLGKE
jgi:hypothetical protein